jgi:carboxypeptidase Q
LSRRIHLLEMTLLDASNERHPLLRRFLLLLLLAPVVFAQDKKTPPAAIDTAGLTKLQDAALQSDYAFQITQHLTDNVGPRLSGSPQLVHAAEWLAAEMRRIGLTVTLEKVMVPHWVRGQETAELVQFPEMTPNTTQKIVLTALGDSVATPAQGLTADVVVVNNFDELATLGREKVQGKIVLFHEVFDQRMAEQGYAREAYSQAVEFRGKAPSEAAKLGAVAALVRSVGGASFRLPHTGGTHYEKGVDKIPAAALAAEDADLLMRLAKQGPVRMHLVLTPQMLEDSLAYNVIGDLKGSQHPDEIVIVSGHLDSWDLGTGALDDAAGVGIAMGAIRAIKDSGSQPKRTVRVIAWANEENGLRGGLAYAKDYAAELPKHQAGLESDLGAGHPTGFFYDGDPSIADLLENVKKVLERSGAGSLQASEDTGADLIPSGVAGVPTLQPIHDARYYFNYHHTAADTLDKIVPQEMRDNVAAMAVMAKALADIDQRLPQKTKPLPKWMQEIVEEENAKKK